MSSHTKIIEDKAHHYRILKMPVFRKTPGVIFDLVPLVLIPNISAIDRVIHSSEAFSPGPVGNVERPWYMHTHQADNLVVLQGVRFVELYSMKTGELEKFEVGPDYIKKNGEPFYEGGCMLTWPTNVFHRIISGPQGSASINFASHREGIDMRTNFNIYELDQKTGKFDVLRYGHEDQDFDKNSKT